MPIADAIADAETFRLFMVSGREFCGVRYPVGWMLGTQDLSMGARKYIERGWAARSGAAAMHAARAAFLAVPELRV